MQAEQKKINIKKIISYWQESSQKNFKVAEGLFRLGHYTSSLFFCQLSLEKLLKGLVVQKTGAHAPPHSWLGSVGRTSRISFSRRINERVRDYLYF